MIKWSSIAVSVSFVDLNAIEKKFQIVRYNIQSISDKLYITESEFCSFDIICLTETWLDQRTSNNTLFLNEYNL